MLFSAKYITPNRARFYYDVLVSYFSMFIPLILYINYFNGNFNLLNVLIPLTFVSVNFFLGLYGHKKAANLKLKIKLLLISVLISSIVFLLIIPSFITYVVWLSIFCPMVLMPRYFLNISKGKSIGNYLLRQRGGVLIIGGAGYIGSHLVELLLDEGEQVVVLDRLMYGKKSIQKFISHQNFKLIQGDATDIAALTNAMRDVSSVVHLAGLVGDPACAVDENFTRHTNIVATKMVKQVAQSMGIHRFVFASSCSVYGVSDFEIDEGGKLSPVSLYAKSKVDSEEELRSSVSDDFIVTILRFATVFGDSLRPRFDLVANLFTAQALNGENLTVMGPNQWRPFIHAHDLARAIGMTLKADPKKIQNQIFNVGDERLNMTILDLAKAVKKVANSFDRNPEISIQETNIADKRNYAVSFQKINKYLGFTASILMEDGIREMAEKLNKNEYGDYKLENYSNVKITELEKLSFYNPISRANLYGPL